MWHIDTDFMELEKVREKSKKNKHCLCQNTCCEHIHFQHTVATSFNVVTGYPGKLVLIGGRF